MNKVRSNNQGSIEVVGILVPSSWGQLYEVTGLTLYTFDEQQFLIDIDSVSKELLDLTFEKILIIGKIQNDDKGQELLHIEDWSLVEKED